MSARSPHRRTWTTLGLFRASAGLLALAVLIGSGVACTAPSAPASVPIPGRSDRGLPATVNHVIDGDTVDLQFGDGTSDRARLLGIDTPETVKPNAPVDCFGPEASARAKELLPAGTAVVIQRDEEARDRYGRLLVYIWRRSDGLFVNSSLVVDGFARTLAIAPNNAHRSDLSADAATARANGSGLWAACADDG